MLHDVFAFTIDGYTARDVSFMRAYDAATSESHARVYTGIAQRLAAQYAKAACDCKAVEFYTSNRDDNGREDVVIENVVLYFPQESARLRLVSYQTSRGRCETFGVLTMPNYEASFPR